MPNDANEDFFKTLMLALWWKTKQLELKQSIMALHICDVIEDIDFSLL